MATMLNRGKELIRIDPANNKKLQCSTNDGRSWTSRFSNQNFEFQELTDNGSEILATTSKGVYVSKNEGRSWTKR